MFHVNGIMQHVVFCVWLLLFSMMFMRLPSDYYEANGTKMFYSQRDCEYWEKKRFMRKMSCKPGQGMENTRDWETKMVKQDGMGVEFG